MSQEEGDVPAQHGTSPSSYIPRTAFSKRDSRQAAKLQQAVGKPFQTGDITPSGWEPNLIKQATKLFLTVDKTLLGWEQNYFQALKIYFQALVIYFQALIIYFQGLKIIFRHVLRNFMVVHKGFLIIVPRNKHRTKGRRSQGAKDHRRGCTPPAPDRREEPPEQGQRTIISPKGATE